MPISPRVEFQPRPLPRHREPGSLRAREVCPHCKRELVEYRFGADGVTISTGSCAEHGDVPPMKSAISNPAMPRASAAVDLIAQP
jgi:hypothetical protein